MRSTQNTAFMKRRLSSAIPPHCPLWPGSRGPMIDQDLSSMSWRRWEASSKEVSLSSLIPPPLYHIS